MIIKNKLLKDRIFYWLLAFCLISLPFPDYSFNSQAIIAFSVYWVFYNSFSEKRELFFQNKFSIILLSSLFWVPLLGAIYTNNLEAALDELRLKLPFLIFPLILLTVRLKDCRPFVMNQFLFGVLAASLLALSKVGYFKVNNLGNYFYYSKFSEFLDKHTTYFSLFIVICLLWLLWLFIHKKANRLLLIIGGFALLYIFYLLSVRISIIALAVGSLIIILSSIDSTWKRVLMLITVPVLLGSVYFTPYFQKRFEPSTTATAQISDMDFRELHWKAVLETINHNNLLIGYGTRSQRDFLYNKYKEYGLTSAYKEGYNAHNQYLEVFLEFGLLGFVLFLSMILYLVWLFKKKEDYFALSILLVFLVYMLTESIFQRHSGIVIFSFLIALYLNENISKKKANLLN
ncbi:MAG TPA: O-antigen ligase family protein [Aequorivita sp.]|nr:O-antigen ligase family protein [Aequorivita sp.]|tara:strand:- start:76126 stop:77331 length:1206 start_codon:yes stop_codon:yes gene_type:complete